MAICVFDIFQDGTAQVSTDTGLRGPGAYRWWHFDLGDPDLEPWARANLHEIPAGSLVQGQTRPRCDRFDDGLILNLRGINMSEGQSPDEMNSIRIYVEENLLITVRRNMVFALSDIREAVENNSAPESPANFLEILIQKLTTRVQAHIATIDALAELFERDLESSDTVMPRELPEKRRSVIRLRRYLGPQRVALGQLAGLDIPFISDISSMHLHELANRTLIAVEELDELRDRLESVQEEHDANVVRRQSRHGYVLTVAAAIFLPMGFLTGLFGVNIAGMPGLENPMAFTILCISIVALGGILVWLLRLLRWF